MELIKQLLQTIHPISDELLAEYLSHWKPIEAKKKSILTAEGQVEKHMYFVLDGIQKSYHIHQGKAHVIAFTYPPSFSGIPESFFTQKPSKYFLETITDSSLLRIHVDTHRKLMQEHREIETLFRKGTEMIFTGFTDRYLELMAYDIETRLHSFVKRSPHLLNMVSQKDLASYLRINETNFSKLLPKILV